MTNKEFYRFVFFVELCRRMLNLAVVDAVNNPIINAGGLCSCQRKRVRKGSNSHAEKEIRECALGWIESDDVEYKMDILGLELTQVPFLIACDVVGEDPEWIRSVVRRRIADDKKYGCTGGTGIYNTLRNEHIDDAVQSGRYNALQLAEIFGVHHALVRARADRLGIKMRRVSDGPDLRKLLHEAIWKKYPGAQVPGNDKRRLNKECTERVMERVRRHNEEPAKEARKRAKQGKAVAGAYSRRRNIHHISGRQGCVGPETKMGKSAGFCGAREEGTGQRASSEAAGEQGCER